MAERIFREKGFSVAQLASPQGQSLIAETFGVLRNAISFSITQEVPEILTYALENNAFVFSGFKTFHALREVGLSLTNPDGSIKPFERFLNDVQKINNRYNHNYLRAEYNQAVAASQMAVRWHEFEQDGDDYYLQYRTANDGRVREEHALLHNTTLPVSDPFWNSFLPPNGWNCRCTAVQVRKGKYPMSDPELAMQRGLNCTDGAKRQIFRFNPGKSMRLFPDRHPYMPKGCGDCDKRLNLANKPGSVKCAVCDEVRRQARIKQNGELYKKLLNDTDYKDVEFNPETGALKATHVGHISHNAQKSKKYFDGLTSDDLERKCQEQLFRMGHSAILRDESQLMQNGNFRTSLDLLLDGVIMDIRSITQINNVGYGAALRAKNKQLRKFGQTNNEKANAVCLYFYDSSFYSKERILNGIEYLKKVTYEDGTPVPILIEKIYCVVNGMNNIEIYEI